MTALRQSVSLPMFQKHILDRDAFLLALKEIGYQGVEIWGRDDNFEAFCASTKRAGLQISAMIGARTGWNDEAQHAKAEAEVRVSIDLAAAHGIPNLICLSGNRREGVREEEAIEVMAKGFLRVAKYAEEKSVTLVMQLLNSKVDHPGYQADHTAFGVEVCRRVDSPRVRLLYDIYHMQIMEGDVIRTLRENSEWIGHLHTAGNPGRSDLDDTQELNYRAIARAVSDMGYQGFVAHEFSPKKKVLEALQEAYEIWHT